MTATVRARAAGEREGRAMASDTGAKTGASSGIEIEDAIHGGHRLAPNALGVSGVLFCCVTGAAPIAAMLFNTPVAVLGAGWAAPATFWIACVVLTLFSVGYVEMARRVTAAGGFYSFISQASARSSGMGSAVTDHALLRPLHGGRLRCDGVLRELDHGTTGSSIDIPVWLIMFVLLAVMSSWRSSTSS